MWKITNTYHWPAIHTQFDWIRDMEAVPQDPVYHAEGDVAIHTRMVLEALLDLPEFSERTEQEQHILCAAALLHDVEKRSTTQTEPDGRVSARGHARRGEYTARTILYRDLPAPFAVREAVAKLVRYHGLPLWALEKYDARRRLLRASLEVDTQLLYMIAKADILGRICPDQDDLLYRLELFRAYCEEQHCWGRSYPFPSERARFNYFLKEDALPDYDPYPEEGQEVVVLSGLPGVGKDTYVRRHYPKLPVISLDALREKYKISPRNSKANGKVIQLAREQARQYLRSGQPFVWNSTNLTMMNRGPVIELCAAYRARPKLVYLEAPYEKLIRQNAGREAVVPGKVLERYIGKLEMPSLAEAPEVVYEVEE